MRYRGCPGFIFGYGTILFNSRYPLLREHAGRSRRHMVVGVDLAMRVRNSGPHFGPAIFKDQHIGHIISCPEYSGALGPQVNDLVHSSNTQRCQGGCVIGGIQDHLATIIREGWPAVDEPMSAITRGSLPATGTKRAISGSRLGWHIRTALTGSNHVDRSLDIGIKTQVRQGTALIAPGGTRGGHGEKYGASVADPGASLGLTAQLTAQLTARLTPV